jgi:phosphohistidine phosphatase
MLQLYLLRHAKAEAASPTGRDHDRRLAASGQDDAQRMGVYLERHAIRADRTVLSTAARVQETWAAIAPALSHPPATISEPRLFNASVMDILDVIRAQSDKTQSLMLVGHNPGLHDTATLLLASGDAQTREKLREGLPTSGLVGITLVGTSSWREIRPQSGRLDRFIAPRDLVAATE